jgi:hypothetical protein
MSRRRSLPSKDWRCIVVCADGHPSGKLAALGYEPEDIWMPTSIEDINSGTERLVTRRGATVSAGGGWRPRSGWRPSQRTKVEETKPGRDVPISWDTLNLVAGTLHQHNVARLELADLEAMLKGNSREAGPS